jgi:hypothetical protein
MRTFGHLAGRVPTRLGHGADFAGHFPVENPSVSGQSPLGLVPFWVRERLLHSEAPIIHLDVKQ